jgi:hypothetical protein
MKALKSVAIVVVLFALCSMSFAASAKTTQTKVVSSQVIGPENKYALLAGTDVFEYLLKWDPVPGQGTYPCIENYGPIPSWELNVKPVRDMLVNDLGWMPDHIDILMNESNTKVNLLEHISALKQYDSPDSLFFIFICGHGWVQKDRGSLLPGDEWDGIPIPGVDVYVDGTLLPDGQAVQRTQGKDPWDEVFEPYDGDPKTMANFIVDDELQLLFDDLAFEGKVVFLTASCCGGGLIEDIQRPNLLSLAVGNSDRLEEHWWVIHLLWTYAVSGAWTPELRPSYIHLDMNPDTNGDGMVSVEEAYAWAVAAADSADPNVVGWGGGQCAQYMFDGIDGETFL